MAFLQNLFHPELLMEALPIMGTGYLGIFIVTGVIIGVVGLLNKLGSK